MKKLYVFTIVMLVVCIFVTFVACDEVKSTNTNAYDPTIILSGNVEKVVKYTPDTENNLELNKIELSEVLKTVKPLSAIKSLLILTHGSKCIQINNESISMYYLSVNANGIVRLDSTLDLHSETASLPLVSISEIIILTDDKTGIKYNDENGENIVDYFTVLRSTGMLTKIKSATVNDKFDMTVFNYKTVSAKTLIKNHEHAIIRFENGSTLEVNSDSTQIMYWANGGLRISNDRNTLPNTEKNNSVVDEIEFANKKN